MAVWTTPKTWNVGDVLTASDMNTYVRDNTLALYTVIDDLTVAGSVLAAYDTNTRLGGNLPTTFKHLLLIVAARGDTAAGSTTMKMTFNNDTAAHYDYNLTLSGGPAVTGPSRGDATGVAFIDPFNGVLPANTGMANKRGHTVVDISDYNDATFHHSCTFQSLGYDATAHYSINGAGSFNVAAAITRMALTPGAGNFAIGSRFSLYGRA